jgi:hypothetical protein
MSAAPLDSEVFDDPATIDQAGRLAEMLREWNELVRAEIGSVQSFPHYDEQARVQQGWHQWLVGIAAIAGSGAVLLAILQLTVYARPQLAATILDELLAGSEYVAAVLALVAVGLGLAVAFHTRWQLQRMKTEQYRFLKFQFLLHAGGWLEKPSHQRRDQLQTLLAGIHALDRHDAHDWAQGVFSLFDDDPAVILRADAALTDDIVRYFRAKRIGTQRDYFQSQGRLRHDSERRTWLIPPACFFLSIIFAFLHFAVEIFGHSSGPHAEPHPAPAAKSSSDSGQVKSASETPPKPPPGPLMLLCLLGAAAFPVIGAMVRTMRTAFEFGRNANRFEGVARTLARVDEELAAAASPAVRLELLREAEFVLQHENRSWMRLMIEAEWFG